MLCCCPRALRMDNAAIWLQHHWPLVTTRPAVLIHSCSWGVGLPDEPGRATRRKAAINSKADQQQLLALSVTSTTIGPPRRRASPADGQIEPVPGYPRRRRSSPIPKVPTAPQLRLALFDSWLAPH